MIAGKYILGSMVTTLLGAGMRGLNFQLDFYQITPYWAKSDHIMFHHRLIYFGFKWAENKYVSHEMGHKMIDITIDWRNNIYGLVFMAFLMQHYFHVWEQKNAVLNESMKFPGSMICCNAKHWSLCGGGS